MRNALVVLVAFLFALPVVAAHRKSPSDIVDQAKSAIESGDVDLERDIAPAIELLGTTSDPDALSGVIDGIESIGAADGSSPATVKRYVLEKATPLLVAIAKDTSRGSFLRGDAITALRDMGAPRSVLTDVANMALADRDEYVKSRGEILQNFIASMPAEEKMSNIRPVDSDAERDALVFLKERNLGVSLDQLRRSSLEGNADEVKALLAAGVDPNGGSAEDAPLLRAVMGCTDVDASDVVATINALTAGGADVKRRDSNKNTYLLHAAQYCGPEVARALIAHGAEVNAKNWSGMTPLGLALVTDNLDTADALVAKGAKLSADELKMVAPAAKSARAKAIIAKATQAKKK